jgi:hypothetical protein
VWTTTGNLANVVNQEGSPGSPGYPVCVCTSLALVRPEARATRGSRARRASLPSAISSWLGGVRLIHDLGD